MLMHRDDDDGGAQLQPAISIHPSRRLELARSILTSTREPCELLHGRTSCLWNFLSLVASGTRERRLSSAPLSAAPPSWRRHFKTS